MGCNPSDQGGGLNIIRQVGVLLGKHRGMDSANSFFYKKVRSNIARHSF